MQSTTRKLFPSSSKSLFSVTVICTLAVSVVCVPPYGRGSSHGPHGRRNYDHHNCNDNDQVPRRDIFPQEQQREQYPQGENFPNPANYPSRTTIEFTPDGVRITEEGSSSPPSVPGGIILKGFPPEDEKEKFAINSPCPAGYGIHKESGKCYPFNSNSQVDSFCGPLMSFYKSESNPAFGECDCKPDIFRPKIYWPRTDKCYWLFDQGPCQSDEWVILNDNDIPICNKRSCPQNSPEEWSPNEVTKRKYWFRYKGKCYKSDSKGFCEDDPEMNVYYNYIEKKNEDGKRVEGYYTKECKLRNIGSVKNVITSGGSTLPCRPGHRSLTNGECRRSVTVE